MANTWFAFKGYNNGKAVNVSTFDMTELDALGFHGYPNEKQAEQKPNSVPGFPNPLAAIAIPVVNAAIDDANNARDVRSAPGNAAKAVADKAKQVIPGGIDAIGKFFGNLTKSDTWIRTLKVIIGGLLMVVGLAKLTGIDNGIIGTAVKKAPLL